MEMGGERYIPMKNLVRGAYYICKARNFLIGKWNGEAFDYMRHKWGNRFQDVEYHWDYDDRYGTVKPFEMIEEPTDDVKRELHII